MFVMSIEKKTALRRKMAEGGARLVVAQQITSLFGCSYLPEKHKI